MIPSDIKLCVRIHVNGIEHLGLINFGGWWAAVRMDDPTHTVVFVQEDSE